MLLVSKYQRFSDDSGGIEREQCYETGTDPGF